MKGLSPPMDSSLTLTLKSTLGRFAGTAAITTLADLDPNLLPARSDLEASRVWAGILTEAAFPRAGATLAPKARVTLAQVFDIILIIQRSEVSQLCARWGSSAAYEVSDLHRLSFSCGADAAVYEKGTEC